MCPLASGVAVAVVQVRVVSVFVNEDLMAMLVRVGFAAVPRKIVFMPMMCVVGVGVGVREGFVAM